MLYYLFDYLSELYHPLAALKALTLRAILSSVSALTITLCLGNIVINYLSKLQVKQVVRNDGPKSHYTKSGTPTMGGILILSSVAVSSILWGKLNNLYFWLTITTSILFGTIGWIDDYRKLILQNSKGLTARYKYAAQSIIGLAIALILYYNASPTNTILLFPIFKDLGLQLGYFYIVFSYFVIVGSSNAVNLTDGLDGLAIMPIILITGALGLIAYLTGNHIFANYLHLPYIAGVEELCIITSSVVGAGLGFLWFNSYPALIFMGDVGSLSLGALLGTIAVIIRQELLLFIMGGIFVVETMSVMLQVASFKLTSKRIFRMAPIHHHFELKGWPEPRVIVRFWIITVILVLFGLITLKLR